MSVVSDLQWKHVRAIGKLIARAEGGRFISENPGDYNHFSMAYQGKK